MASVRGGFERAPIAPFGPMLPQDVNNKVGHNSLDAGSMVLRYRNAASKRLGLGTDHAFFFGKFEQARYEDKISLSQGEHHFKRRTVSEVAKDYLNCTTSRFVNEFRGQHILDIGCGEGWVGRDLVKKAKADVTFLDRDPDVLEEIPESWGAKVHAEATSLEFEDESFDGTLSIYSSIFWAESPLAAVQALNEQLRVTAVGGTALMVPLFQDLDIRVADFTMLKERQMIGYRVRNRLATFQSLELKDVLAINALERFAMNGMIGVTWISNRNPNDLGDTIEVSAIIDKYATIPQEVFDENIAQTAAYCSV